METIAVPKLHVWTALFALLSAGRAHADSSTGGSTGSAFAKNDFARPDVDGGEYSPRRRQRPRNLTLPIGVTRRCQAGRPAKSQGSPMSGSERLFQIVSKA
jgi:hypothetical protein